MEKNGKINKNKYTTFRKSRGYRHFSANISSANDVLGSYTGTPVNTTQPTEEADLYPTQDADDL